MKRVLITAAAIVAVLLASVDVAGATLIWGDAQTVPGLGGSSSGSNSIASISCSTADDCTYGGGYESAPFSTSPWVAFLSNGQADGLITSPATSGAYTDFSCTSDGGCSAVGDFSPTPGTFSVFTDGSGSSIAEVPGLAAINTDQQARSGAISCTDHNTCSMIGQYSTGGNTHYFVADMIGGVWGNAQAMVAPTNLNVNSGVISCWSANDCVAAGVIVLGQTSVPFTLERTAGVWGIPVLIPGMIVLLPSGGISTVRSISCASDGTCAIGGGYVDNTTYGTWLTERVGASGTWTDVHDVPGISIPATAADVRSITCWAPATCTAVGAYAYNGGNLIAFSTEFNLDSWSDAQPVPGISALGGIDANALSVSCATDGLCAMVGNYFDGAFDQGWVRVRQNGVWADAVDIPGLRELNDDERAVPAEVSCVVGGCAVGGAFTISGSSGYDSFIVSLIDEPTPTTTTTAGDDPLAPAFTG